MPRILLLCFIHGFKGNDDTFHRFPEDLKRIVSQQLPDNRVESVVYPKYETKGELAQATSSFLAWLKEKVIDVRKAHLEQAWPPNDRDVGVVLVAHSMGGFVAADTLFLILNEAASGDDDGKPIFPLIQGILTFDTPFNGLARSMFVYGAFSNYQKVSSVFNTMAALTAAAPAGLASLSLPAARRAANQGVSASKRSSPGWQTWQLVAVRTGTVGAIAAGGVAAYVHREAIMQSMRSVKNLNKSTVVDTYRQGMDAIGQGLAYINRGNVGKSFAWLSDHFTFVGALMKPKELNRRLERMAALRGVGIRDIYASLGENGYWSGGYFVPERNFCAVPAADRPEHALFSRQVVAQAEDEVQAHMGMFDPLKNEGYEKMTDESAAMIKEWFFSEAEIFDDAKFREAPAEEAKEELTIKNTLGEGESEPGETKGSAAEAKSAHPVDNDLPDESPIDIAAAASLVPLPDDSTGDLVADIGANASDSGSNGPDDKKTYMQHLFRVAQTTGEGFGRLWPSKMPAMPTMPSMPAMPSMPTVPSMKQIPIPSVFSKKHENAGQEEGRAEPTEESGQNETDQETQVTVEEKATQATAEEKEKGHGGED